jgi:phosphohistidine phosphatase
MAWDIPLEVSQRVKLKAMILHLIRHAQAEDAREGLQDADRRLTSKGQAQAERLARALEHLDVQYDSIITSPRKRAVQTAQALNDRAQKLEQNEFLTGPPDAAVVAELQTRAVNGVTTMALVGHEPFLSELVSLLLLGTIKHANQFEFGKCALYALEFGDETRLRFVLPSNVLRRLAK